MRCEIDSEIDTEEYMVLDRRVKCRDCNWAGVVAELIFKVIGHRALPAFEMTERVDVCCPRCKGNNYRMEKADLIPFPGKRSRS